MGCWATGSLGAGGTGGDGVSGNATDETRTLLHLWPTGQPEVWEGIPDEMGRATSIGVTFSSTATLVVGVAADIWVPFACTINEVRMLATESGSCQVGIWKTPFSLFPPTATNSITASATPAMVATQSYEDSTLTGWTVTIAKHDMLRFRVDSAVTIKQCVLQLAVQRTP